MIRVKPIIENKELMKEWDFEQNNALNLLPGLLSSASKEKPFWKCKNNHSWRATIEHRVRRKQGCPICSNRKIQVGFNDLTSTHPEIAKDWNFDKNISISPSDVSYGSTKKVWWKCTKNHEYYMSVAKKIQLKSSCPICINKIILKGVNDLATTHPYLIKEWDFEKNKSISPFNLSYGSTKIVWWKCNKCNYEWQASPNNRTNGKGTNCPVCSNRKVLPGYNDLKTLYPNIAKKWHPTLNKLSPSEVAPKSNFDAYWVCESNEEHYFLSKIYSMVDNNIKCPICSHKKIIKGINDLSTTHPELINEWDFDKNANISPYNISYGTTKKVWWKCKNNHSWKSSIGSRTGSQKVGCPICKKELFISFPEKIIAYYLSKIFTIEENKKFAWLGLSEVDIFIPSLNLAIEYDGQNWHKDHRRDLKKDIICQEHNINLIRIREKLCPKYESSSTKYYLANKNLNHLNDAIMFIYQYINETYSKSFAVNINIENDYYEILTKVSTIAKEKSIASSNLINEWDYQKNKNISPETISLGSHKKIWWKCQKGHQWVAAVCSRSGTQKCGCPYCAGQKIITGENDLKTLFPHIAQEWDYQKNKPIYPDKISPNSNKKYWWLCTKCGNSWKTSVSHRTGNRNCPACGRKKTIESHFKKVMCIETGKIFDSLKQASMNTGINYNSIGNCCRKPSKTAGGFHWKYTIKDDN